MATLEQRLATMAKRTFAVAVKSGTEALYLALTAAGVGPDNDVLVTDFSFIASGSAIVQTGGRPVFVDVDETFNLDLDRVEEFVTHRTRAFICVHLYGQMSNPVEVEAFTESRKLLLIEDAAQAIGSSFAERPAGSLGIVSCYSFNSTKTVSAPDGGGAVLTDDVLIADRVRRLRYYGKTADGRFAELGYNSLMSPFTAAILGFKLDQTETWQRRRQEIVGYYRDRWSDRDDLLLPSIVAGSTHNCHKFVLRSSQRDDLAAHLRQYSIETKVHYPLPLHSEPVFHGSCQASDRLYPNSLDLASTVLTIPAHALLTDAEVEFVAEAIRQF